MARFREGVSATCHRSTVCALSFPFPAESAAEEPVILTVDEFEALRLVDHEGHTASVPFR